MSDKTKMLALILCIVPYFFLGLGGIHRFYTGKYLSGAIQLFTGGGFLIWQLIDLFMILGGSFTDANDKQLA